MKNLIVAQSGGPTAAINASLAGVIYGAQQSGKVGRILGSRNGIEGVLHENFVDLTDFDRFDQLKVTPAMALGSCRYKLPGDVEHEIYNRIDDVLKRNNVGYVLYIGGNDSMDTVLKLSKYYEGKEDAPYVIGVPKTVDNDLPITDHTPGYGSAAKYLAITMQELIRDLSIYAIPSVTIVEIMGRDAGWLTLATGLPRLMGGMKPDIIAIPEVPFDENEFLGKIRELHKTTNGVVIAVSEGIRDKDGNYVGASAQSGAVDTFGHAYLSGVGKYLELLVKDKIGCKVRSIEVSLMQRCASHLASKVDLDEGFALGEYGAKLAAEGNTGLMAALKRTGNDPYTVELTPVDVALCANKDQSVPEKWFDLENEQVKKEICDYILPLIEGEPEYFTDKYGFSDYVIL